MFDWDDLRIFLAVARARKLGPASRALGMDATTVGRRLTRLTERLGTDLFEVAGGERRLTEAGQILVQHAEQVEDAALAALADVAGDRRSLSGQVRLSVAEGFGSWILAPGVADFHAGHPGIRLDMVTASGFLNPSKREADMAVLLGRPQRGRLLVRKLGDYRLHLYATRDYIVRKGEPGDQAALKDHVLIGYVPEFLYTPELDYLGEVAAGLEPVLRSTSINVQYRMITGGAGIGVLPDFIARTDDRLVPVLSDSVEIVRSFWLATHADLKDVARMRTVAEWLYQRVATLG